MGAFGRCDYEIEDHPPVTRLSLGALELLVFVTGEMPDSGVGRVIQQMSSLEFPSLPSLSCTPAAIFRRSRTLVKGKMLVV